MKNETFQKKIKLKALLWTDFSDKIMKDLLVTELQEKIIKKYAVTSCKYKTDNRVKPDTDLIFWQISK